MRHARASAAHGGAPSAPPSGVAGRARRPVFGPRRSGGSAAGTAGGAAAALAQRLSAAVQAAAVSLRRTLSPRSLAKALVQWPPRALCVLVALGWLLIWLASFHPGDETLRALSDGPLALMLSPAGVTFGTRLHVPFALKLKPGAAPPPVFDGSLNLTAEAVRLGQRAQPGCFAALLDESPTLLLADAGTLHVLSLDPGSASGAPFADMACVHFTLVGPLTASSLPHPVPRDDSAPADAASVAAIIAAMGRAAWRRTSDVAIVQSATSAAMMAPYTVSLRNHAAYARTHGYDCLLALVPSASLRGRSGKFAKHYALGTLAAARTYDILCHLDLDAWFASWEPLEQVTSTWPPTKELLIPDAAQLWINSGLMLVRGKAPWSGTFFQRVFDAHHHAAGRTGFKRDQPAIWHTLASDWKASGDLPAYKGEQCSGWMGACNPDNNPVACWHACFWTPLLRGGPRWRWHGFRSLDALPHLHVPLRVLGGAASSSSSSHGRVRRHGGRGGPRPQPPLHKLCLASCPSALARGPGVLCVALFGRTSPACAPAPGVDALSRCDGAGCAAQLASAGGAWVKHSGHQHWRDVLRQCVPLTAEEARQRLTAKRLQCHAPAPL